MSSVENAIAKLREQQSKVPARSGPWMVAEQLMDICRHEPFSAEIIAQDLDNPDMSIQKAERQIKAFADKNRKKKTISPVLLQRRRTRYCGNSTVCLTRGK